MTFKQIPPKHLAAKLKLTPDQLHALRARLRELLSDS